MITTYNRNTKQLSLTDNYTNKYGYNWNDYKALDDVNAPTQQEQANFEAKYEYAVGKATEYIRQVTIGDWSMRKFKKAIKETNKQLDPYGIQISELTKRDLNEFIEMGSEPYEVVETDAKYADIVDPITETWSYNAGFGGNTL